MNCRLNKTNRFKEKKMQVLQKFSKKIQVTRAPLVYKDLNYNHPMKPRMWQNQKGLLHQIMLHFNIIKVSFLIKMKFLVHHRMKKKKRKRVTTGFTQSI